MILFNWKTLKRVTGGKSRDIMAIIKMLATDRTPKNRGSLTWKYAKMSFGGESFLYNPLVLVQNYDMFTERQIIIYIMLASMRSLADYAAFGTLTLDTNRIPDNLITEVENNPLLRVHNGKLHFTLEETPKRIYVNGAIIQSAKR